MNARRVRRPHRRPPAASRQRSLTAGLRRWAGGWFGCVLSPGVSQLGELCPCLFVVVQVAGAVLGRGKVGCVAEAGVHQEVLSQVSRLSAAHCAVIGRLVPARPA